MKTYIFYESATHGFFYIDPRTKNAAEEFQGRGASEPGWKLHTVKPMKYSLFTVLEAKETPQSKVPGNWLKVLLAK